MSIIIRATSSPGEEMDLFGRGSHHHPPETPGTTLLLSNVSFSFPSSYPAFSIALVIPCFTAEQW